MTAMTSASTIAHTKANEKALFVMFVDHIPLLEAHWSPFFAKCDWFIVLTSRSGPLTSRYGDFFC